MISTERRLGGIAPDRFSENESQAFPFGILDLAIIAVFLFGPKKNPATFLLD